MKKYEIVRSRGFWATVLAAFALVASGCGGGDGGTTANGAASTGDDGVTSEKLAEAKATVEQLSKVPETVTVDAPLTERPKPGTTLAYVAPPEPATQVNLEGLRQAAEILDFKIESFSTGHTADEFQTAFNSAATMKPDAVWVEVLDPKTWKKWGDQWVKEGIPVVNQGTTWPNEEGETFNFVTIEANNALERPLSDWAVANADGESFDALIVSVPELPVFEAAGLAIQERLKELCPNCGSEILDVRLADIGTKAPGAIVGYLQRNPDTKYLIYALGDLGTGAVQAMKTAGLTDITVATLAAGKAQRSELKNGDIDVNLAYDQAGQGFVTLDFVARALTGQSTQPDFDWSFPTQFETAEIIDDPSVSYIAHEDAPDQWAELWDGK